MICDFNLSESTIFYELIRKNRMNKLTIPFSFRTPLVSNRSKFFSLSSLWHNKNEDESKNFDTAKKQGEDSDISEAQKTSKARLSKLNNLLKEMIEDSSNTAATPPLKLAKPISKWGNFKRSVGNKTETVEDKIEMVENKIETETPKTKEQDIVSAAKEVAETLGGDKKQTESELLKKLFGNDEEQASDTITSLSDIFKGMKIDRSTPQVEQKSRSEQVRQIMGSNLMRQQPRQERARTKSVGPMRKREVTKLDIIDLYGSEPLGIFTSDQSEYTDHVTNSTWEALTLREMKLLVTHPPSNHFQQMILWTEQGKLWKFPIDNEQGLEEENNISFAEHIFLDKHLEPWCPPKGPLRHFMELVCVGLSKNPYLTVNSKIEHIEWYRNYFENKRQLLKDVGAALNDYETHKAIDAK